MPARHPSPVAEKPQTSCQWTAHAPWPGRLVGFSVPETMIGIDLNVVRSRLDLDGLSCALGRSSFEVRGMRATVAFGNFGMKLGFDVIESAQKALPYISGSSPSGIKSDERCLTGHFQRNCNLIGECVQVLWVQFQVQVITFRNHLAQQSCNSSQLQDLGMLLP